ncbi:hypothetical protein FOC4_g10013229, partial [Fusarium odoratissimum]
LAEDPDVAYVGQYKTLTINTVGPIRLTQAALKASLVSMVKSLSGLKRAVGVRNAAICPGPAHTPIFEQEFCRYQEPQYGDRNIVEIMMIGSKEEQSVHVREVGLEGLLFHCRAFGYGNTGDGGRIEVL